MARRNKALQRTAEKLADITMSFLSQFPEEEQERRIRAFERAVLNGKKSRSR